DLLTRQIIHLSIDILNEPISKPSETLSNIFVLILCLCKRLISLNFCQLFYDRKVPIRLYDRSSTSCISSTLTKLKISVTIFADCLYLLDGRLDCLTTLIIDVKEICRELSNEVNVKELPKLKCFSLTSVECTFKYDDQIIPLLRRMTNLEELMLFLIVLRKHSTFIDGILLHAQILIYMQRLNKFSFSIISDVLNMNIRIILPTNEDIRRSFMEKEYNQVDSYVHTRAMDSVGRCHIYSLPYQFENFLYLNNSFQGGKFDKVRCLEMNDSRPFEYDFFKRISEDFPFLKELRIWNIQPQKEKQHLTTLIVFPHLMLLNLVKAHVDYAEQLLFHKNTYLPCLLDLCINYKSLAMVTNNFTNDAARFTCAKLKRLRIDYAFVRPSNFNQYFPLL
ncbi:unnamed protein product, partial [Rotaria sp. Silwood2]